MRIKIFAILFSLWAIIFSVSTILNLKIAFEYDDGFAYSGDSFRKAKKEYNLTDYSQIVLKAADFCQLDRIKLMPAIISSTLAIFGIKTHIIFDRPQENSCLVNRWGKSRELFFVKDLNEKYTILENKGYLLYFCASDEGIIQAMKARVKPIRVERGANSQALYSYKPGKFSENKLPLSSF